MVVWGGFDGTNFLATGGRYNPTAGTWQAVTAANAPAARADATAVWTGSEMIVWGGQSVSGGVTNYLNTGGRYDPIANVWQSLPTSGAPVGSFDHTAVWSGSEMIVWGGQTQAGRTNSGARYQRLANVWSPLSAIGAPAGRSQHSAVWAGTQMIVWGGSDGTNELASGAHYDPVRDSWAATASTGAPPTRQRHTAVWSGTEMIVWGGLRFNGQTNVFLDDAYAYTPPRTMFLYLKP
jgi:N-acetylneuraminic acid mutarotase